VEAEPELTARTAHPDRLQVVHHPDRLQVVHRLDPGPAPVPRGWTARFALVWLGLWAAQLAPVQLLLPLQLAATDPAHKVRDFGLVNGATGLAALVALPLFGVLCDATRTRFGARRVWASGGVAVFAAGLLATGRATTSLGVGAGWLLAQLGMDAAVVALSATIADRVPVAQRGAVSAAVYAPQALGLAVGLALVAALGGSPRAGYPLLAVLLVVVALPWLAGTRDGRRGPAVRAAAVLPHPRHERTGRRRRWTPDHRWAFTGRLLVNLGNALGTTYLLYFLTDGLHRPDPETSLLELTGVYLLATVASTWAGGVASDRTGRRRVFAGTAGALQAAACLLLVLDPSWPSALAAGVLLGAGYGAYTSVDQALVTDVLPDAARAAGDLGWMSVAVLAPQALAPLLAAAVIAGPGGGYGLLFALAGVTTVAGALAVFRIRGVR
jgi:MFS family permease